MSRFSRPPEIALAFNTGIPHLGRVAQGIRDYAQKKLNWRFLISPETQHLSPSSLVGWKGDGVIAVANTPEEIQVLKSLDCPVVNLSGAFEESVFPRVRANYERIGEMAAEYLINRGYRRFGFYGTGDIWYSNRYEVGFQQAVEAKGFSCASLNVKSSLGNGARWDNGQAELELWLSTIEQPFAIMASHDPRAAMVIRACERINLSVPDTIAVMGVNNDIITCESCHPGLTSISRNDLGIGRKSAQLLDKLIEGRPAPEEDIVVEPGEVFERASTDFHGVDDSDLDKAVRFAKAHFRQPIGVENLVSETNRSRRWLEDAFQQHLGCTPSNFIAQLRFREAKQWLAEDPSLSIAELATRCGYSGGRQLNAHFQKILGQSVRDYVRNQSQAD